LTATEFCLKEIQKASEKKYGVFVTYFDQYDPLFDQSFLLESKYTEFWVRI